MLIDFTDCPNGYRDYGGSDGKRSVEYKDKKYMLKLPEFCKKTNDLQTSHVNNVLSEYLGSHIIASLGLPTHNTILGLYNGEPAVACEDFTGEGYKLQEFSWMMRSMYDKDEIGRIPTYNQLYDVISNHPMLQPIKEEALKRYWDTFIADALIGNFDRHKGNWGYLVNETTKDIKLAPIYDCGSCLYPGLSEEKMNDVLQDQKLIEQRMYDFPKAALNLYQNKKKEIKAAYYDFISSGQDQNCTMAFARIYPRIDLTKINHIVENTPFLSDQRIQFYTEMIRYRKELILDKAFEKLKTPELDREVNLVRYTVEKERLEKQLDPSSLEYRIALAQLQEKYRKVVEYQNTKEKQKVHQGDRIL